MGVIGVGGGAFQQEVLVMSRLVWVSILGVASIVVVAGCEDPAAPPTMTALPFSSRVEVGHYAELTVTVEDLVPSSPDQLGIVAAITPSPSGAEAILGGIGEDDVRSEASITMFEAEPTGASYSVERDRDEATHTVRVYCVGEGLASVDFTCRGCNGSVGASVTVECTGPPMEDGGGEPSGDGGSDAGVPLPARTPLVAYVAGDPGLSGARHLFVYTAEGETVQLDTTTDPNARVDEVFASPDGRRLFFGVRNAGMYSVPSDGSEDPTRLSREDDNFEGLLTPSHDFSRVGYQRGVPGPTYTDFTVLTPDGTGAADLTAGTEQVQSFVGFSPDGMWAAFDARDSSGDRHLWTIRTDGTELGSMASNALNPFEARWAFTSNHLFFRGYDASGDLQLFVGPGDRSSPPMPLTTNGPRATEWLPTGSGLVNTQLDPASGTHTLCRRAPPSWDCEPLFTTDDNLGWIEPSPGGEVVVFQVWEGASPGPLYEVPLDGSAPARLVSADSVHGDDFEFSTNPAAPGYAFRTSAGLFWRSGDMSFSPREPIRLADPPRHFLFSPFSPDLAFIADHDDDGADELYVQPLMPPTTGGGTELPPFALASAEEHFVREAEFVPGGVVYRHDTRMDGNLVDIFLFLFGAEPRRIASRDRIDEILGLLSF